MLAPIFDEIPAIKEKGLLSWGHCELEIKALPAAHSLEEAWKLLPDAGSGVITLADRVLRFDPAKRAGLLIEAEVVGAGSTTKVRLDGPLWKAWRWTETESKDGAYRYVEYSFLSTEPGKRPDRLVYRQYWRKEPAQDGILVWQPVGSRFCGFKER